MRFHAHEEGSPSVYQLKITLLGIDPLIWRCIQIPNTVSLSSLHDVLQAVMGWTNSHLHQFEKGDKYWGVPNDDGFEEEIEVINESRVSVEEMLKAEGDAMIYVYDFGDDWRHEVVLEEIVASHLKTLERRTGTRSSWRSSSSRDLTSLSITGNGRETRSMRKSSI
jgi:hypothetical protein